MNQLQGEMVVLHRKRVGQTVVLVIVDRLLDMCFDVGRIIIMCREPAKDKESRKKKW